MNVPLGYQSPVSAARNWSREQETCTRLRQTYELPVIPVQYEELISEPTTVMTEVLEELGEEVEPACFSTQDVPGGAGDTSANEEGKSEYWKNLNRPIMKSNSKKYRAEFDAEVIRHIESITKASMIRLGYTFDTAANWEGRESRSLFDRGKRGMGRVWRRVAPFLNFRRMRESSGEATETAQVLADRMQLAKTLRSERRKKWIERNGAAIQT